MKTHVGSVGSAVKLRNGQGILLMKKNDGVSGGLSESQKERLRRNVPSELRDANAWLGFKYETRPGSKRRKKIPIDPETGERADPRDGASWATFEQALVACERRRLDAIGYALMAADNITGLDLDDCRDPHTGKIDEWAQEIISQLDSYTEITVSGTGLRVFVRGKWHYDAHRVEKLGIHGEAHLEIYSEWFFAVTGDHLDGTPRTINRRADVISSLHSRFFSAPKSSRLSTIRSVRTTIDNDDALIEKACSAENGEKFQQLWEGNWESYPSESEADIALCGQLAFWTGCDKERMDTLFRLSGRFRPKWDEKHFAAGDTYGEHTLRVAIDNSTATYGGDSREASPPNHGGASVCIADVQSHPVRWLWRGWIPRGKVTLVEGDPGLGKSLLTLYLAARITKGLPMPDGSHCERGSVVIVNAEDGLEDTVKPRLEVAGADIPRCHWLNFSLEDGQQTLIIPGQMDALKKKIDESKPVLVIIDPLVAYLEQRINSWNDQHVRRAMAALSSQIAEPTGVAIVLIRHPNKKEDVKNKIYRGGGSIGIIAAARSALLLAPDSHNPKLRVLSTIKTNLSKPPTPLLFGVERVDYEDADEGMPKIVWHGEQSQATAHPASTNAHEKISALEDAKEFLRESLGHGAKEVTQLFSDAHNSKISLSTLRRAKTELKVKSVRDGFGDEGVWFWKLSPEG